MSTRKYIGKLVKVQWLWRRWSMPFWLRNYIGKYELIECPGAINGQFGAGLSQEPHPATPSTKFVPWNIVKVLKVDICNDLCLFVSFRCYWNLTLSRSEWFNHFAFDGSFFQFSRASIVERSEGAIVNQAAWQSLDYEYFLWQSFIFEPNISTLEVDGTATVGWVETPQALPLCHSTCVHFVWISRIHDVWNLIFVQYAQ